MIKLKQILNEINSDQIGLRKYPGKSKKGIDTYYYPDNVEKYKEYVLNTFTSNFGYRGVPVGFTFKDERYRSQNHVLVNPKDDFNQRSVDSSNLYYILFSELDSWKEYNEYAPNSRSKSIKFSNNKENVFDIYTDNKSLIYRVHPKKNAKVFCSPYTEGFLEMSYMRKMFMGDSHNFNFSIRSLNRFLFDVIQFISFRSKSNNPDFYLNILPKNKKLIDDVDTEDESTIRELFVFFKELKVDKRLLDDLYNSEYFNENAWIPGKYKKVIDNIRSFFKSDGQTVFYDYLNDIFDPKKNKILLLNADSNEFKSILKSTDKTYEFWTSDVCFLEIDSRVNKKEFGIDRLEDRTDELFFK